MDLEKSTNSSCLFRKAINLLNDPFSVTLTKRHAWNVESLLKHFPNGFLIKDVGLVGCLVGELVKKLDTEMMFDYLEITCRFIDHCGLSFLQTQSSDVSVYFDLCLQLIQQFGALMRTSQHVPLQKSILNFTQQFISKIPFKINEKVRMNSLEFNYSLIIKSCIFKDIVEVVPEMNLTKEELIQVLSFIDYYSSNSEPLSNAILSGNFENMIKNIIDLYGMEDDQLIFNTIGILFNIFEFGKESVIKEFLDIRQILRVLYDMLLHSTCLSSTLNIWCQIRNDLLMLITLIVSKFTQLLTSDHNMLIEYMVELVIEEDTYKKPTENYPNYTLEYKKSLLNLISLFVQNKSYYQILNNKDLIKKLISYISLNDATVTSIWPIAYCKELKLVALVSLSYMAPMHSDIFHLLKGPKLLTELFLHLIFNIKNSEHDFKLTLFWCSCCLHNVIISASREIMEQLLDEDILANLITSLEVLTRQSYNKVCFSLDFVDENIICFIFVSLGSLSQYEEFKTLVKNEHISVLFVYITTLVDQIQHNTLSRAVIISLLDCLWNWVTVLHHDRFIDGITILCNLLQFIPFHLRSPLFGILLEILKDERVQQQVLIWRGTKSQHIFQLLIDLWREEENHIRVRREANGVILDENWPLAGWEQVEKKCDEHNEGDNPSPSIQEISLNNRAKIYSIFVIIGFNNICIEQLTYQSVITLLVIQNYLDLKLCEVWQEIMEELKREEHHLVDEDDKLLDRLKQHSQQFVRCLIQTQRKYFMFPDVSKEAYLINWAQELREINSQAIWEEQFCQYFKIKTSFHEKLEEANCLIHSKIAESRKLN